MPDYAINTKFSAQDRISGAFNKMGNRSRDFGNRANRAFGKASTGARGFGDVIKGILGAQILRRGFQLLKEGFMNFITQAQMIEDATASFVPLMGSVDKATQLVEALNETAARTPFQFEGISNVASQLLPVMNGSIEDTISTFEMLGDTAGGNINKLESITRGYTKALLKGRPDMESLNMIAEAGVPIFTEMAKTMGITVEQLFELSKQGLLTNDDLTKTFQNMTSEGGIFFEGMVIASQTLTGKLSTLQDNVNLAFAAIGTTALPLLKDFADKGIEVAQSVKAWVDANQELIRTNVTGFLNEIVRIFSIILDLGKELYNKAILPLINGFSQFSSEGFKLSDMIQGVVEILQPLLDAIFSVVDLVGWLIGTMGKAWRGFNTGAALTEALANVMTFFAASIQLVVDVFNFLRPVIEPIINVFMFLFTLILKGIGLLYGFYTMITSNVIPALKAIGDTLYNLVAGAINFVMELFRFAGTAIVKAWEAVSTFFLWIWNDILVPFGTWIDEIFGGAFSTVADAVIVAWQGVADFFTWIWDNVIGPIVGFITDAITTVGEFMDGFGPGAGLNKLIEERRAQEQEQNAPNEQAPNTQEAEAKTFSFLGRLDISGAPEGSTVENKTGLDSLFDINLLGVNP